MRTEAIERAGIDGTAAGSGESVGGEIAGFFYCGWLDGYAYMRFMGREILERSPGPVDVYRYLKRLIAKNGRSLQ